MKITLLAALGAALCLCACQTSNQADYMQMYAYGPSFDAAHAQCELQAGSVNRGFLAIGSPAFVLGGLVGNAIDNAVAQDRFMKNCLIINGWKRVPRGSAAKAATTATAAKAATAPSSVASMGMMPPGGWINQALLARSAANKQCVAGNKAACKTRNKLGRQLRAAGWTLN
jgi:hypothetical protein